jgi:hypothetical protein
MLQSKLMGITQEQQTLSIQLSIHAGHKGIGSMNWQDEVKPWG